MNAFIETVKSALLMLFGSKQLAAAVIAAVPIVETRGAVPIALGYGLEWWEAFFYPFLGSSLVVPVLLAVFLPLINRLMRSKIFSRLANAVYEKFESKSKSLTKNENSGNTEGKTSIKSIAGLFVLVLIPVPLTGVWTGCAVASIMRFKYKTALITIILSNLFASLLVTLICVLFKPYINQITLAVGLIAIAAVITLLIKTALHNPETAS